MQSHWSQFAWLVNLYLDIGHLTRQIKKKKKTWFGYIICLILNTGNNVKTEPRVNYSSLFVINIQIQFVLQKCQVLLTLSSVCLHAGGGFTWSDWDEGFYLSSIYLLSSQCLSHKHRKEHAEALDTDAVKKQPYLQAMTCTKAQSLSRQYDSHIYTRHTEMPVDLYIVSVCSAQYHDYSRRDESFFNTFMDSTVRNITENDVEKKAEWERGKCC